MPVNLSIISGAFCSAMVGFFGILLTIILLTLMPNSLQAITVSKVWLSVPIVGVVMIMVGRPVLFGKSAKNSFSVSGTFITLMTYTILSSCFFAWFYILRYV